MHPEDSWRLQTAVLEVKDDNETYLVAPQFWPELMSRGEIIPKILFTAISKQGVVFLWPIRLPGEDDRLDSWNQSALEAARVAMGQWVRLSANRHLAAYDTNSLFEY